MPPWIWIWILQIFLIYFDIEQNPVSPAYVVLVKFNSRMHATQYVFISEKCLKTRSGVILIPKAFWMLMFFTSWIEKWNEESKQSSTDVLVLFVLQSSKCIYCIDMKFGSILNAFLLIIYLCILCKILNSQQLRLGSTLKSFSFI